MADLEFQKFLKRRQKYPHRYTDLAFLIQLLKLPFTDFGMRVLAQLLHHGETVDSVIRIMGGIYEFKLMPDLRRSIFKNN